MDFHQLRIFVEVTRLKGFSRAAENIFLSQPTISAHIKTLENEIGAPLFDRSQRELHLTDAGKILFKYAQELLEIKEEALSAIEKEYKIISGHLEIAASSVPGAYLLPGLLASFHRQHPEITFSVMIRDTKQVIQSIKDYTYSLGFTGEPGTQEGLEQVKLVEDELILIAPKGTNLPVTDQNTYPLLTTQLSSILQMPFILREPGSATRKVFEKTLKKHSGKNITLNIIGYIESLDTIKEAVKAGLGLTVISKIAVEEELRAEMIEGYRLQDLPIKRNFYLTYRKKRILPPINQAFLEFTVQYFTKKIDTIHTQDA
ncbi:MAG: selenium metabolism-associated LysR family transcriptional regulator [Bacillota bacterium]|nr:selenium metabolism-associated LysR family transcriptional regulator [Bacillota bacterium]